MQAFITLIHRKFAPSAVKPLGRWNINYCDKIINRKIDLSNEDHCGPCGQYIDKNLKKEVKSDKIIVYSQNKQIIRRIDIK